MARAKSVKVFESYLVVEGVGEFPLDMLRYDCAFPATEQDAGVALRHERDRRRVMLIRRSVFEGGPEVGRWASFGWKMVYAGNDKVEATATRRKGSA